MERSCALLSSPRKSRRVLTAYARRDGSGGGCSQVLEGLDVAPCLGNGSFERVVFQIPAPVSNEELLSAPREKGPSSDDLRPRPLGLCRNRTASPSTTLRPCHSLKGRKTVRTSILRTSSAPTPWEGFQSTRCLEDRCWNTIKATQDTVARRVTGCKTLGFPWKRIAGRIRAYTALRCSNKLHSLGS